MPKANAERQAEYRKRQRRSGKAARLNMWLSLDAALALRRLAKHQGVTRRALLEQLIDAADRAAYDGMRPGSAEWNKYFNVTA